MTSVSAPAKIHTIPNIASIREIMLKTFIEFTITNTFYLLCFTSRFPQVTTRTTDVTSVITRSMNHQTECTNPRNGQLIRATVDRIPNIIRAMVNTVLFKASSYLQNGIGHAYGDYHHTEYGIEYLQVHLSILSSVETKEPSNARNISDNTAMGNSTLVTENITRNTISNMSITIEALITYVTIFCIDTILH